MKPRRPAGHRPTIRAICRTQPRTPNGIALTAGASGPRDRGSNPCLPANSQRTTTDLRGRRYGVEFKHSDAPTLTKSLHIALADLKLDRAWIVYPGREAYPVHEKVELEGVYSRNAPATRPGGGMPGRAQGGQREETT